MLFPLHLNRRPEPRPRTMVPRALRRRRSGWRGWSTSERAAWRSHNSAPD